MKRSREIIVSSLQKDHGEDQKIWSASQSKALKAVEKGKNIYISGAGGVGKSEVIKEISRSMKEQGKKVAILSHTGIAALTINGQTIWHFMKFYGDLLKLSKEKIAELYLKKPQQCENFKSYKAMIIDEISMVDPQIFELMDHVLQQTRRDYRPFGGLQIILVGDFFQIPSPEHHNMNNKNALFKYVFQCNSFWKTIEEMHDLREVWRQNDKDFIELLHRVRKGAQNEEDIALLNTRIGIPLKCEEQGIKPTVLYSRNKDVDKINEEELAKIKSESFTFKVRYGIHSLNNKTFSTSSSNTTSKKASSSKSSIKASSSKSSSYNGEEQFKTRDEKNLHSLLSSLNLLVNDKNKDVDNDCLIKHCELKVGAQVMLCYNLDTSLGLVNGSRGIIIGFGKKDQDTCCDEDEFTKKTLDDNFLYPNESLPIVKFVNCKVIEIPYVRYTLDNTYAWRICVKLSWATSIHKSQSLTLDAAEIDLSNCFDAGMAYVALSRVKDLSNLRIISKVTKAAFQVDQEVLKFYEKPFGWHKAEWIHKNFSMPKITTSPPQSNPLRKMKAQNDDNDIVIIKDIDGEKLYSEDAIWEAMKENL